MNFPTSLSFLQTALSRLPRERFALEPTPVHSLDRLRARLGKTGHIPKLLIKRDDLNGVAFGGNKLRKLEWLLGEALMLGCDTLVTAGAAQSNHCRQTAGVGAMYDMEVHLCLRGPQPKTKTGNLVLDEWLGAHLHFAPVGGNVSQEMIALADALRLQGKCPYTIPIGGSNAIGAVGYAAAVAELLEQGVVPDYILVPTGSGGTQAGIEVGVRLLGIGTRVIGIGVATPDGASWQEDIAQLATETAQRLGSVAVWSPDEIVCPMTWMGPHYGAATSECQQALRLLAQSEGVFLDPVYSGKAMAGVLAMIGEQRFSADDTVLFWHTGGAPALFA